jgi:hypothetical protein
VATNEHPEIPNGIYCYEPGRVCPHWGIDPTKPEQDNGYCTLLGLKDWEDSLGLLWDQVKACGINDELEEDEMGILTDRDTAKPYKTGEDAILTFASVNGTSSSRKIALLVL